MGGLRLIEDPQITIKPLSNFSGNGVLKGTLAAYRNGEPTGWEMVANWSDVKVFREAVTHLCLVVDIDEDRATKLLAAAIGMARKMTGDEPTTPIPLPRTSTRPEVKVTNALLDQMAEDCWAAIVPHNQTAVGLYAFGGVLSDLVHIGNTLKVRPLNVAGLRNRVARMADFVKVSTEGVSTNTTPPRDVIEDLIAEPAPPRIRLGRHCEKSDCST